MIIKELIEKLKNNDYLTLEVSEEIIQKLREYDELRTILIDSVDVLHDVFNFVMSTLDKDLEGSGTIGIDTS